MIKMTERIKHKKWLFIFVFILLFGLVACTNENNPSNQNNTDNRKEYTVSFFTDCDMTIEDMTVKEGDTLPFIPVVEKDGYEFVSWDSDITAPITSDIIFEAIWVKANYKINYHLDGGTNNENNPATYTIDDIIIFEEPKKGGYKFIAWFTDEAFTKKIERIRKYSFGEIDLYAKFEEVTFTINYHLDGGKNDYRNPESYAYSETKPIELFNPTKTDYTFVGWYKEESFINLVTSIDPKSETNYELFARFTKDDLSTSTITFNTNGGVLNLNRDFDYSVVIQQAKATMFMMYDTQNGYKATVSNTVGNTYYYYICVNRVESVQDMYVIVDIAYPVSKITATSYDYVIAWHASLQDTASKEALMYIYNNHTKMIGCFVEMIDLPTSKASTCDIDLIFYPKEAYDAGNTYHYKNPEVLPTPTKNGYTFLGWVSSLDGKITTSYPGYYDPNNITYTAQWIRNDLIGTKIEQAINELNINMGVLANVDENINLMTSSNGCSITWNSLTPDIVSNTGVVTFQYSSREATLEATISDGENTEKMTYTFKVKGKFKDLSNGVKAGYFYSSSSNVSDYTFRNLDIMYMAFAYPTAEGGISNFDSMGSAIQKNYITKAHENGVRVIISINTQNCSTIAASEALCEKFADTCVNFINKYNVDGIDMDWEWPSSSEVSNFTRLMKAIYTKVKANNPDHLITAAVGSAQSSRYDLRNSQKYLDYISIMTYDMQSNSKATFQNALYYKSGKTYISINDSYNSYTNIVPASKIIIGIPFYARYWTESTGVATTANYQGATSYSSIYNNYITKQSDTVKEYFDEDCQVPYVYDSQTGFFASYDNPTSIDIKAKYAKDQGLAGLMFWQYGQDKNDMLITALIEGVNKYFKQN